MGFISILSFAHQLLQDRIQPGEAVIDATAGNGVDTVFLAKQVGTQGVVYAFDIQAEALASTSARCAKETPEHRIELIHRSHAELADVIPSELHGRIAAVTFNLGYLPGFDHETVTLSHSTLQALKSAAHLLRRGGIISVVLYTGHPGGPEEAAEVEKWASSLSQAEYQVLCYRFMNQKNRPPYLIAIEKR